MGDQRQEVAAPRAAPAEPHPRPDAQVEVRVEATPAGPAHPLPARGIERAPASTPPTPPPPHTGTTLVVEEGVFRSRLRRPRDLVGAVAALAAAMLVIAVALTAQATTIAIDSDLTTAQQQLPDVLWGALSALAGLGLIVLPVASSISMLLRGRGRQLLEAIAALTVAAIVLTILGSLVRDYGTDALYRALTGLFPSSESTGYPTNPLLGGLVAFVTTARLLSRPRWGAITALTIGTAAVVATVSGASTVAAQGLSLLIGASIGLLVRYVLGTPTTRPSGSHVAQTLMAGGIPLVMLRARGGTESGRRYLAVTASGEHLDVDVLDRDLEGSGLLGAVWRSIRLRESNDASGGLSMRGSLDHASLMAFAAEAAGVPTPRLLLAAMVSADSALLAFEAPQGRVVVPGGVTDENRPTDVELDAAWQAVALLQQRFMAHQNLHAEHVRYAGAATTLTGLESGVIAAGDVARRLDVAELLVTQALQAGVPAAVASARRVLGDEGVLRALPVLQRVAMSGPTRGWLREHRTLLGDLRSELLAINPQVEFEQIELERLKPRTVITLVLGSVAGYLLLSQLVRINVGDVLSTADWHWAGVAMALSIVTYVGAALSVSGFVPDAMRFLRTVQAQFAASFATLVSPPTLGAVAVNARYLNRSGLPPAAAAATIAVSQVAAFTVHVGLMLVVGIAAGTQADLSFNPPRAVIIGMAVVALVIGAVVASVGAVRRWLTDRIRPMIDQVIPRLATVAQRPVKLIEGFGGTLLLNVAYCLCLVASVRAFSDQGTIAAISFVYLAGSTLGQAAPTPGGLGVVEAALVAGLTAAGVDGALAVSATLLFRLVTFWVPTVPGWFAFRGLTNRGLL
ncbi:MAG TPA: lysylphosphatidylglycerol synthase transmembrane domain-containing protein [Candidatus Nanopelagicales bacterium]